MGQIRQADSVSGTLEGMEVFKNHENWVKAAIFAMTGYALSLHVSIALMGIFHGLGLVVFVWGLFLFKGQESVLKSLWQNPTLKALLIFLGILTLATIIGGFREYPVELTKKQLIRPYKKIALWLGIFWFSGLWLMLAENAKQALDRVLKVYFWIAVAVAIFGFIQFWGTMEIFGKYHKFAQGIPDYHWFHATGLIGFHLSYAGVMIFPFGLFLAWLATSDWSEGFVCETEEKG